MLRVYSSIHVFTLEVGSTPCSAYILPYTSLLWRQVQHHAPGIFFHTHLYSGGRFNTAPGISFHKRLYSGGRFNTMLRVYSYIHVFTLEVGSTPCSGYIFPYMSLLWRQVQHCSGYFLPILTSLLWRKFNNCSGYFNTNLYSGDRLKTAPGKFFHIVLYSEGRFTKVGPFEWSVVNLQVLVSSFSRS